MVFSSDFLHWLGSKLPHSNVFLHFMTSCTGRRKGSWPRFSLAPPRSRRENSHEARKPVAETWDDNSGYFRLNWSRRVFARKSKRGRRDRHRPRCCRKGLPAGCRMPFALQAIYEATGFVRDGLREKWLPPRSDHEER